MKTIGMLAICILAGCTRSTERRPADDTQQSRSTVDTVVEGATGYTAVQQGIKAKQQIRDVAAKRERDLEDALGGN